MDHVKVELWMEEHTKKKKGEEKKNLIRLYKTLLNTNYFFNKKNS